MNDTNQKLKLNINHEVYLGHMPPLVGLKTTEGVITKVNEKSIRVRSYNGVSEFTINANAPRWPSVQYMDLTDAQIISGTFVRNAGRLADAQRVLNQDNVRADDLIDIIQPLLAAAERKLLGNETVWDLPDKHQISCEAKIAMINKILS